MRTTVEISDSIHLRLIEEEAIIVPAVCIFELLAGVRAEKYIQQRCQLLDLSEIAKLNLVKW